MVFIGTNLHELDHTEMLNVMEKFESKSAFIKKAVLKEIEFRKNK